MYYCENYIVLQQQKMPIYFQYVKNDFFFEEATGGLHA